MGAGQRRAHQLHLISVPEPSLAGAHVTGDQGPGRAAFLPDQFVVSKLPHCFSFEASLGWVVAVYVLRLFCGWSGQILVPTGPKLRAGLSDLGHKPATNSSLSIAEGGLGQCHGLVHDLVIAQEVDGAPDYRIASVNAAQPLDGTLGLV